MTQTPEILRIRLDYTQREIVSVREKMKRQARHLYELEELEKEIFKQLDIAEGRVN